MDRASLIDIKEGHPSRCDNLLSQFWHGRRMMPELHEQAPAEQKLVSDISAQLAEANKRGLQFSLGTQKALLDEMIEVGSAVLEHTQAQINVATEFASKIAEAHSFGGVIKACQDCGQHQMDVVRQDSQRFVAHGRELLDKSFKLLETVQA
jgi:hypothetical protein